MNRIDHIVIAAANLQSYKLVFLAVLFLLCCVGEVIARRAYVGTWQPGYKLALVAAVQCGVLRIMKSPLIFSVWVRA